MVIVLTKLRDIVQNVCGILKCQISTSIISVPRGNTQGQRARVRKAVSGFLHDYDPVDFTVGAGARVGVYALVCASFLTVHVSIHGGLEGDRSPKGETATHTMQKVMPERVTKECQTSPLSRRMHGSEIYPRKTHLGQVRHITRG